MVEAEARVKEWWEMAYIGSDYENQFYMEAEASLTGLGGSGGGIDGVFEGMQHQRLRLRLDQQLLEWFG